MATKKTILEQIAELEATRAVLQAKLDEENKAERAKNAAANISKLVEEAYAAIRSAEVLADEFGLDFSFSLEYGMGGTYQGKGSNNDEWNNSSCYGEDNYGWNSSSSNC